MVRRSARLTLSRLSRQTFLFALLVMLSMLSSSDASGVEAAREEATKKVLIFSSYDPTLPGVTIITQAIRATLRSQSPAPIQFYQASVDSSGITANKYEELMVSLLREKYAGEKIDLVFALGGPAMKALLKVRADLLPDSNVVFYYYDESEELARHVDPHTTGVWARPDYGQTIEIAFALNPETEHVFVVAGSTPEDKYLLTEAKQEFRKYESRAEFTDLTDLSMEELQQRLAGLPEKSTVIFLSFFIDSKGNNYSGPEALSLLAPSSSAPIYGIARTYLGKGIVGGSLLDFEASGRHVGQIGTRILGGERPEDIPPQPTPGVTMFDWRELKRWGIGEKSLPPGSLVEFKEPSFWDRYEWYIIAFFGVVIIESLLITSLLINRVRRRQAEEVLRQSRERLLRAQQAARIGTWEWDLTTGEARWSEGMYELLGLEQGDGKTRLEDFAEFIHVEDRERVLSKAESVIESGEEYYIEFRIVRRDGTILWMASKGRVVGGEPGSARRMIGVNIDITERKRAEEALRQTERRNLDIVRAMPDLMFVQNGEGVYLDYHADDKSDLYVPPEVFIGKRPRDVLPPDLAEAFLDRFQRAKESGEPQVYEYMLPMHGETKWYEARIVYTEACQFLSIVRDVTERKRAESQLAESEERFRNMADTAPVMIWMTNDQRQCIYLNQRWLDFTGRTLEEELDYGWADGVHPDDHERCAETYNVAYERREPFRLEYRLRRADGEYRWIYDSGTPRISATGKFLGYIGSCIDVTDRRLAEVALRESRAQLAEIIGSAMDAIITIGRSQRIILFNTAAEQMFRCSAQEAIGRPIDHFVADSFQERYRQILREFLASGVANLLVGGREPVYARRADGEGFPVEASISQTELDGQQFYTVILRDITERRKAENALKESEANYRAIFNGVNEAIFVHDKETGAVIEVNQKACEMYGVTAEEATSFTVDDLSADEPIYSHEAALKIIRKAAEGEAQLFEWQAKDKQGRVFWVEVSLRLVVLGGIERVLAVVHDITDRKQAEEALRKAFTQVSNLKSQLEAENIYLKEELGLDQGFGEIVGESEAIRAVFRMIQHVAQTNSTALVLGETGTGKELVARAIHSLSLRKEKPLIRVNCATLPATLIESELFGHEKGAFTGATARQLGRFELANGGTIFLDEIGDLPLELQSKLLRVLEEGEFERLGSGRTIKVNVRVIAATNRDLAAEVLKGTFREDLWYRLNVFPITVPPLRERIEDIPLLVQSFVWKFSKELGKPVKSITPATMSALQEYSWPGNIRELANVIERAMINTVGETLHLADRLITHRASELPFGRQTLEDIERQYILRVLEEHGWRIEGPKGAARVLGLNPSTLRTRMAKLGIHRSGNGSQ